MGMEMPEELGTSVARNKGVGNKKAMVTEAIE